MKLFHYSEKPFTFDPAMVYTEAAYGYKPIGLWVSVGEGWKEFCEGDQWNLEGLAHTVEVTLREDANVLLIENAEELDKFNAEFKNDDQNSRNMDWARVKKMYDGLVIAPYLWGRRHEFMWYYGWDCASGVIWNLRAIDKVSSTRSA